MNKEKLEQLRMENLLLRVAVPKWNFRITTPDIDWRNGSYQYLEISSNVDITFSHARSGFKYVLKILIHNGYQINSWDPSIRWASGTIPLSSAVSADTISYYGFLYLDNGTSKVYDCIAEAEDLK